MESKRRKSAQNDEKKVEKKGNKKIFNSKAQDIFCIISLTFIIGCIIIYGSRLVKYYKIYNPNSEKSEILAHSIIRDSQIVYEGDGIYSSGGNYIYKGDDVNNYIVFSNQLWRIVQINMDNSIDIVLEDYINVMKWGKEISAYPSSDVQKFLNNKFLNTLNKNMLEKTTVCLDTITGLNDITCNKIDDSSYVKILDIANFLNSFSDSTYLKESNMWLSSYSSDGVWITNGDSLSVAESDEVYAVKPVVTLKNTSKLLSGTGTKDDPFMVDEPSTDIYVGANIKLANDIWTVYEIDGEYLKLSSYKLYNNGNTTYRFDTKSSKFDIESEYSLAHYLNSKYYDSLSYKDMLVETSWYIGNYDTSYSDVYDESIKAKVGLLNISDIKYNDELINYYLSTPASDSTVYIYGDDLSESKIKLSRPIRPAICIKKTNILSGTGTTTDPYVLEVQ